MSDAFKCDRCKQFFEALKERNSLPDNGVSLETDKLEKVFVGGDGVELTVSVKIDTPNKHEVCKKCQAELVQEALKLAVAQK